MPLAIQDVQQFFHKTQPVLMIRNLKNVSLNLQPLLFNLILGFNLRGFGVLGFWGFGV